VAVFASRLGKCFSLSGISNHDQQGPPIPPAQSGRSINDSDYRLMVETVTDSFMLDPSGFTQNWNAGARALKGYRPEEILLAAIFQFFIRPSCWHATGPSMSWPSRVRKAACLISVCLTLMVSMVRDKSRPRSLIRHR